jgi:hypothetical protein
MIRGWKCFEVYSRNMELKATIVRNMSLDTGRKVNFIPVSKILAELYLCRSVL